MLAFFIWLCIIERSFASLIGHSICLFLATVTVEYRIPFRRHFKKGKDCKSCEWWEQIVYSCRFAAVASMHLLIKLNANPDLNICKS